MKGRERGRSQLANEKKESKVGADLRSWKRNQ